MPTSRNQAVTSALASEAYPVGMCARWTRERYGFPALGDHDRDGDADAVDMWKASVLKNYDRTPPAGVPVFWSGGSKGHGHAAVSLGGGRVRSIDMTDDGLRYQAGNVGTTTVAGIERAMGLKYLGWTIDLYGHEIPDYDAERATLQRQIDRKRARRQALKAKREALAAQLASLRDLFRKLPR